MLSAEILGSGFLDQLSIALIFAAIVTAELKWMYTGGASNSDADASLGGAVSSVEITTASDNNLFDDVSGDEASPGDTEYRCLALKNTNASITLQNSKLWFTSNTTSADDTLNMALAATGLNAVPESLANESTAPTGGESFSAPASKAAGLSVGNVPASQYYPIFLQRIVSAAASAVNGNSAILKWEGDTTAA